MRGAHLLSMHGFEMQNSRSSRHLKRLTGILIPTSTVRYSMSSRHSSSSTGEMSHSSSANQGRGKPISHSLSASALFTEVFGSTVQA